MSNATHRVGACAYVFNVQGELLLLKRNNPPLCWGPPGGGLEADEDPLQGLRRELREECGLEIDILGLAGAWFGAITPASRPLLALDYIGLYRQGEVTLSAEHQAAAWVSRDDLVRGRYPLQDLNGNGYRLEDLEWAWELLAFYRGRQ